MHLNQVVAALAWLPRYPWVYNRIKFATPLTSHKYRKSPLNFYPVTGWRFILGFISLGK